MVHRHILSHRKDESRLTHRRTGGMMIDTMSSAIRTSFCPILRNRCANRSTLLFDWQLLKHNHRFLDDRIDLGNIFLHITLGNLKKLSFRFLHKVFHIDRLIKSLALYHAVKEISSRARYFWAMIRA